MAVLLAPRGWGKQKPPLGVGVNWAHPLTRGLIAQWLLNEGAGDLLRDSVGVYHAAILQDNKVTWRAGEYGLKLNNISTVNSLRSIQIIPKTPVLTAFTWEARIRTGVNSDGYGSILSDGAANGMYIRFNGAYSLDYFANADNQGAQLVNNTDYHCVVSQKADATFTFYVDGVVYVTGTGVALGFDTMFNDPGSETFNGDIYYQRLWNRPLTQPEARILQADPYCIMMPPQRRLWIPEQAVTTITDSDTGSGADAVDSLTVITDEAMVGVDTVGSLLAAAAAVDTATVAEASSVALTDGDTGSAADTVASMAADAADTAAGVDTASVVLAVDDMAAGDEASTIVLTAADTGLGVEDQQVNPLVLMVSSADVGASVDAAALIVSAAGEVGSGGDAALSVAAASGDTGQGADVAVPVLASADTGSGADTGQLTVNIADTALGGDTAAGVALTAADTGAGADSSTLVFSAADMGAAVDAVFAAILLPGDTGSGVDTQAVTALVNDADVGLGLDQGRLILAKLCAIVTPIPPAGIVVSVRVVAPC